MRRSKAATARRRGRGARGFRPQGDFASAFSDVFDDLFGDFMGRGGQQGGGRNRAVRRQRPALQPADHAGRGLRGPAESIMVPTSVSCQSCKGTGAEGGSEPADLPDLFRHGARVRAQQGFFTVERACPTCSGTGQIIKNPCKACHGAGRVEKEKQLSVSIPAGVETGTRIRLAGEGEGPACAAGRRAICTSHRGEGTRDLPTRRRHAVLQGAGQHGRRRAGR